MKPAFWARKAHKWIGLVIGVQALLWMVSGLYMTVISIDVIHGDHLAHGASTPLSTSGAYVTPAQLAAAHPGMTGFRLKQGIDRAVYEVKTDAGTSLVDATTGEPIGPLDEAQARRVAESLYQGDAPLASLSLLTEAPQEVASRPVPMWQARFDDRGGTTLYLSPTTGELLAKRHDLWRWFDFLWMLHIMDYEAREDVNNTLLRIAAAIGFIFALSGVWLLCYSFKRGGKA
jgi:hypothetical protein